ncbi:methyltransferase-like protein 22 isoform X2 [Anopheles nili]|uniref:methyltransferase-like protein 22 isoform X2 n=1 Tax=Anopheles nili TaxID=185578 RepID=UPI00237BE71A|nr:methyltransferase-like protein 22 isoform X2 [Anopheles nili]
MAALEVTSELYAEAEFTSKDTDAISKFTFVYPNRRVTSTNGLKENAGTSVMDKRSPVKMPPAVRETSEESFTEAASYESDDEGSVAEYSEDEDIGNDVYTDDEFCKSSTKQETKPAAIEYDSDGDAVVERPRKGTIEIEHCKSTRLDLVGLQIWRGALLLADYILHNERKFRNSHILELGSGVGLTSIVASMYAREVICTDIDIGGLLDLIRGNVQLNASLSSPHCRVNVTELDFKVSYQDYPRELKNQLQHVQYVIAADVIYDDNITEAFVRTIVSLLLELPKLKSIYIALEKRYVFTLEDMDSVAPCYDYFLQYFQKRNSRFGVNRWKLINVCMDFPRYFEYDKVKDLVLLKICHAGK